MARISNHNYYHEKSALREAIRQNGIHKFISKFDIKNQLNSFDSKLRNNILIKQKELEGKFRGFSLHCGGIVYFPEGIPRQELLEGSEKSIISQVKINKIEVAKSKNFKIDVLSSRGLSQLYYCKSFSKIDFTSHIGDPQTIKLLSRGDNIGITLAETPLMRKALLLVKPKTIMDLAICLSIIRPAAKDAKNEFKIGVYNPENIIFDDDVIQLFSKLFSCDEGFADKLRRGYCKEKQSVLDLIEQTINKKCPQKKNKIIKILSNLRKYGFCKAHALSYAQLVWQLAYQKAHHPKKFWQSTLKNVNTCYRNWVHLYEAKCEGVSVDTRNSQKSIYAKQRNKNIVRQSTTLEQLRKYGYWNMVDNTFYKQCYFYKQSPFYYFKGLIASSRMVGYNKSKKLVMLIGVAKKKYIEIIIKGNFKYDTRKVIVIGKGIAHDNLYKSLMCNGKDIEFL